MYAAEDKPMTLDELVEDAQRVLRVCNACRYCEGYCAVFPALARLEASLDWFLLTEHTSRGVGPLGKCETNLGGFVGSVAP